MGTKLNLPMLPGATDEDFVTAWARIEEYLRATRPEFILLQCGADSLEGDPITHLAFSEEAHAHAAARSAASPTSWATVACSGWAAAGTTGRNLARAWTRVVEAFVAS